MNWLEYGEETVRFFAAVLVIMVSFGMIVVEIRWKNAGLSTTGHILFLIAGVLFFVAGIAAQSLFMELTGGTMFGCVSIIFIRRLWRHSNRPKAINSHARPHGFLFSTMCEDDGTPKN